MPTKISKRSAIIPGDSGEARKILETVGGQTPLTLKYSLRMARLLATTLDVDVLVHDATGKISVAQETVLSDGQIYHIVEPRRQA